MMNWFPSQRRASLLMLWMLSSVVAFSPTPYSSSSKTSTGLSLSTPSSADASQMLAQLNPQETAVIFCKYQNDFATEGGILHPTTVEVMAATGMKQNSINLMNMARNAGCQIVHCPLSLEEGQSQITHMPYGVIQRIKEAGALTYGEWGSQIIDEMAPVQGDWVVPKYGMCAFASTNLDNDLRARGINNVIVVGFLTNGSVESTIRGAYERCYNVYCLPECCAACTLQEHVFSVNQNFPLYATITDGMNVMSIMAGQQPAGAGAAA